MLTESGNGMKTTRTFRVHGDWDLYYTFNCANFGGQGNFAVTDDTTGDVYVNALAVPVGTRRFPATSVATGVFAAMRERAKSMLTEVDSAVITVPANAKGGARYRTRDE